MRESFWSQNSEKLLVWNFRIDLSGPHWVTKCIRPVSLVAAWFLSHAASAPFPLQVGVIWWSKNDKEFKWRSLALEIRSFDMDECRIDERWLPATNQTFVFCLFSKFLTRIWLKIEIEIYHTCLRTTFNCLYPITFAPHMRNMSSPVPILTHRSLPWDASTTPLHHHNESSPNHTTVV